MPLREEQLAHHFKTRARPAAQPVDVRRGGAEDLGSAAAVVVAFGCGMSGLLMGLCLAASPWPFLAFGFGAVLAGGAVWFARDLMEALGG